MAVLTISYTLSHPLYTSLCDTVTHFLKLLVAMTQMLQVPFQEVIDRIGDLHHKVKLFIIHTF